MCSENSGQKPGLWNDIADDPESCKADLLALFKDFEVKTFTCEDEEYDYLLDDGFYLEIHNPRGGEDIWVEMDDGRFTLGANGWHEHYDTYDDEYRELKEDIGRIMSGDLRFLVAYVGKKRWMGSQVLSCEPPANADGWQLFQSMHMPEEFLRKARKRGGHVDVVSWLPDLCRTYPFGPVT